jgi:hypothetical protein
MTSSTAAVIYLADLGDLTVAGKSCALLVPA